MYTVNSVRKYFDRRPHYAYLRDRTIGIAEGRADDRGLIASGDDWSWLTELVGQDFFNECERDPLGMFKDDLHLAAIPFLRLEPENFPGAQDGDIVVEGQVMLQMGGIEGQYGFDVEVIMVEDNPTTYWHPQMLRGWGGKVQIVMRVRDKDQRELEVRQVS